MKNKNPAQGEPSMDISNWRSHILPSARRRIVNKIKGTLMRHLTISSTEGLQELEKIAVRFEEKIYTASASQPEYLRRISLKMLMMETQAQTRGVPGSLQSNPSGTTAAAAGTG
ncbi:mediator of RNA polymerase II transcription subunit 15a [Macadamia integrifolia]|uniref:mediator of RNA polymerase II transcription subunit 15a n=1 Tax=Macadamia integrifolia TaxID=60698 RepID=UPI001C4F9D7C|nr:mediator of RNA polymerase II transcription subunit 15a [Macadamia integrifolia]XP_042510283.1 mediator of RNA polymerase II transcription subunit 15a [Macadamia integrifolia]